MVRMVVFCAPSREREPIQNCSRFPSTSLSQSQRSRKKIRTIMRKDTINSITSTSPFRFDIFEPSGFNSRGR